MYKILITTTMLATGSNLAVAVHTVVVEFNTREDAMRAINQVNKPCSISTSRSAIALFT